MDVFDDIRKGALPAGDIPGYLFYLVKKSFWVWFSILLAGAVVVLSK